MKNKLPSKYMLPHRAHQKDYNQLIDYLAELTEVVERKRDKLEINYITAGPLTIESTHPVHRGTSGTNQTIPTLKETLLDKISELPDFGQVFGKSGPFYVISRPEVEAIINRVMP